MMPCPKMMEDMRSLLPMLHHTGRRVRGGRGRRHTTRHQCVADKAACPNHRHLILSKLRKGLLHLLRSAPLEALQRNARPPTRPPALSSQPT